MRLHQNQVWKKGDQYIRIVRLERAAVEYKLSMEVLAPPGPHACTTKKEFCRLLKGATLLPPTPRIAPVTPPLA